MPTPRHRLDGAEVGAELRQFALVDWVVAIVNAHGGQGQALQGDVLAGKGMPKQRQAIVQCHSRVNRVAP